MPTRPLYIVDMTLYEFLHILELIYKIDGQLPIKERRILLKKEISEILGTIPMDEGKPPRRLSSSKHKIVQNFMITINQLKLLENLRDTKELYEIYKTNPEKFYQKLRRLLLYKGNLFEYIRAIKKVNQNKEIIKNSQYLDNLAYELYKIFPQISKAGHRKQITYVLKWLKNEKLGILETWDRNGVNIYKSNIKF